MESARLDLTYESEAENGRVSRELPFVIGIIADFSADCRLPSPAAGRFVALEPDGVDRAMAEIAPELELAPGSVPTTSGEPLRLTFSRLDDFRPEAVARQLPEVRARLDERAGLASDGPEAGNSAEEQPAPSLLDQVLGETASGAEVPRPAHGSGRAGEIDAVVARQLDAVLHHPGFRRLEAAWRGLAGLVSSGVPGIEFRIMAASKRELLAGFENAPELDHAPLFEALCVAPYQESAPAPYTAVIADYDFSPHPDDLTLLDCLAYVGASAHAPVLTGAAPGFFGLEGGFDRLPDRGGLMRHFDSPVFTRWRSFRESEDARFVYLTLPRTRGRAGYGRASAPVDGFDYVERTEDATERLWINGAFALAGRLMAACSQYGWGAAVEASDLQVASDRAAGPGTDDRLAADLPAEMAADLDGLGFAAIHTAAGDGLKLGTASAAKPQRFHDDAATRTEHLAVRLPHVAANARIAHYLMALVRENRARLRTRGEIAALMIAWLARYTCPEDESPDRTDARYPLARVEVEIQDGPRGGAPMVVARLMPVFQLDPAPLPMPVVFALPFDA